MKPDPVFQRAFNEFVTQFMTALKECSFGEIAGTPPQIGVYKPNALLNIDVPKTFKGYQVVVITKT